MVDGELEQYAVAIGHVENGRPHPFEVWILSNEQPRCLGAVAKTLSADMRTQDRAWLNKKLEVLESITGSLSIDLPLGSSRLRASSNSAAIARVIRYRLSQLGVSGPEVGEETPLVDALMHVRDAGHEGTLSWTASITNEQTGDEFMVFLPEVELGNGVHRPVAVRLSGRYPRELDGLAALLTLDMAVVAYSTPKPPHISVQTLPAIPAETGHPLHPKPYHPFQSKVGHPFQSKPAVQAG